MRCPVRRDLILPRDVAGSIDYVLLRIKEPTARFRAARHQSGKLEQPDLIEVVRISLGDLHAHDKLWPLSGATLRGRLIKILAKRKLPCKTGHSPKPLTLASLRPGGATWLITQTESAELVRRRGWWISYKTMECYLQEVASTTYLNEISTESRELALSAVFFPSLMQHRIIFSRTTRSQRLLGFLFRPEVLTSRYELGVSGQSGQISTPCQLQRTTQTSRRSLKSE